MKRKEISYAAEAVNGAPHVEAKALGDTGRVEAVVSVFGNVDLQGDVVAPSAFDASLAKWRQGSDPIPIIWSHAWNDPAAHVGKADPWRAIADLHGLRLTMQFDMDDPDAAKVFRLVKERRVKEWSFAYDVRREAMQKDGSNLLMELDIIEAGPTLKGANPLTTTVSTKSLAQAIDEALAEPDALAAPKNLEIARYRKQVDELVAGTPKKSESDVDAFVAQARAAAAADRATEARREAARERLRKHHEDSFDTELVRVMVDARTMRVIRSDDLDAEAARERAALDMQVAARR